MKRKIPVYILVLAASFYLTVACQKDEDSEELIITQSELLAGAFSTFDEGPNAFGHPGDPLSSTDELDFFVGNSLFNKNWVMFGASTTARDGLGPTFNSRSCSGCHFKDGRGRLPSYDGELTSGFLVRLSIPGKADYGAPIPEPNYGDQFQNQSIIDSIPAEGNVVIRFEEITGSYPDGTTFTLQKPYAEFQNLAFGAMHGQTLTSIRVANQMIGLGLLEAISDADILANADEIDANGDGISGRPNYVWDIEQNSTVLGRFGWKANMPNIKQQVAGAFHGDMGLTSPLFPTNNCPSPQKDCANAAFDSLSPEIEGEDLERVVLYSSALAVPIQRNHTNSDVISGHQLFKNVGCTSCHKESFTTSISDEIPELSGISIRPYTDLLLHDMGEGLADNRPDFEATGNEWRTPPLWGIGLFQVVNGHHTYLHDGRARNLEEAILWHGGEAEQTKLKFMQLSAKERTQLIAFLNSL